jgi:glutamate dehydrogenase
MSLSTDQNIALESLLKILYSDDPCASEIRSFAELILYGADLVAVSELPDGALSALVRCVYLNHAEKPPGSHRIEIEAMEGLGPDGEVQSVVQIVNDDMPFLVDSALGELQAHGYMPHLVLHPILKVERSAAGRRDRIIGRGDANWGDGFQESIFIAVVDHLPEAEAEALMDALDRVMREVRVAVTDWRPMMNRLESTLRQFERTPPPIAPGPLTEMLEFCRWLIDGQFTFLGMREYRLAGGLETGTLEAVPGSGLGVLRDPSMLVLSKGGEPLEMTPEIRRHMFSAQPLIITKSDIRSRIHRRVYMDYVGVKTYGRDGRQDGELRIVGLFTAQAYTERPSAIPFLRQKVDAVLRNTGFAPGSHDGKAILNILEHFPRDELFRIGDSMLAEWSREILDLDLRPRVRVLARRDRFDRFISVLVYVPRERFSTQIRAKIGEALERALDGHVATFVPFFPEASLIRVHYIIGRTPGTLPKPIETAALEAEINDIAQMWNDRLVSAMDKAGHPLRGFRRKYRHAFPPAYAETFPVTRALEDIWRIERLGPTRPVAIDFHGGGAGGMEQLHATIFQLEHPIPLSERVPVLENFGFRSIDERSYRVSPSQCGATQRVALHNMVLEPSDGDMLDLAKHEIALEEAFIAVRDAKADNDPFNRLVVAADLDWQMVAVLRAYAAYMRQIRSPYGMRYVSDTLVRYPALTKRLVDLFHVLFDPASERGLNERQAEAEDIRNAVKAALHDVPSLDEDRIISYYLDLISATKRTNFYKTQGEGGLPETLAFKIAAREVAAIPEPKPYREIWCYSPRVEGVHLRFGPIARGGIRWSDRAQDFRTEVLGLCKAQQVKNTVIVPEGAKGGFFPKQLPWGDSREAVAAEAVAAYRIFVSSLLDITDNLVGGAIVPPDNVVRHDGDDPYLVVAADKGTATFSDYANEISTSRGFWLGDAFASGGSAGYDHKKMGITARGAWECVKRHFREMDVDIQNEPFTAVGVGDMSGDVFGNAMLLSRQTRLLAAFDHRDVFIDPNPDPEASFEERKRLFELGRSSWKDFDPTKLSAGGGIFPRDAKSIFITPEIKSAFDIEEDRITPNELIRAVLKCKADLLWFGGIGTYVRAASESDADVGDRANDVVRVTAEELRAKVIGEGANLGITQAGRTAFANQGGRINTDFIDNSAGVNSSDKEVNIKIALTAAMRDGRLGLRDRNALLESMTEAVAADCLVNNYQQSLAISLVERRGARDVALLRRLMLQLEERGFIRRELEGLPSDAEIAARLSAGHSFTRPEIAVLMSWSKIALTKELMKSTVPDDPSNRDLLLDYFPKALQEGYREDLFEHQLRREIVATRIVNSMINRAGPAMLVRIMDATGQDTADIAAAFLSVRRIYGLAELWQQIDALDAKVPGIVQLDLYSRTQGLLLDETAELLRLGGEISVSAFVDAYEAGVTELAAHAFDAFTPTQRERISQAAEKYIAAGVPAGLAKSVAQLELLKQGPSIVRMAKQCGRPVLTTARLAFAAMEYFKVSELQARADHLHVTDYYDRLALSGALGSLRSAARSLARNVLTHSADDDVDLEAWAEDHGAELRAAKRQLEEIVGTGELTISRLTVATSQIRELTHQT